MNGRDDAALSRALGLARARVVALTGGGGKTSALYRLAREQAVRRVLVTTTTRIWAPRPEQAPLSLVPDLPAARAALEPAGWAGGIRALGVEVTADGKLRGVPPEWMAALAELADVVLVEADGAAGLPLTAPRAFEPVIPPCADLVVPVAGADAIGAPLDARHVHGAPEMAVLLEVPAGTTLTPALVARVLLDPRGNVKGAPPDARIVPLINKVDTPEREAAARALAAELFARGAEQVLLARLAHEQPLVATLQPTLERAG
jgi:probable selenium-dependent hydroxylase accessory protein YqeC